MKFSLVGEDVRSATALVGEDVQSATALAGEDVRSATALAGEDVRSATALAGEDVRSATALVGEDVRSAIALVGEDVQSATALVGDAAAVQTSGGVDVRIAIFENIMTPGGHEVEFDRILVEEFRALGHAVEFYVPQNFSFQFDYQTPVTRLNGDAVTYTNSRGLKKIFSAAKREVNRQRWYSQLAEAQKNFDALIVPTSTYRYLRALNHSALKKISVPLIFILHGINPTEAPKFLAAAENLAGNKNIKPVVLTFGDNIFGQRRENIFTIYPPTYTARDLKNPNTQHLTPDTLKIGFFGQYRREKNLRGLLEVFLRGNYTRRVELQVQGSTMHAEDAADFEQIIRQYRGDNRLSFLHKGLIGAEWQRAILSVDALLMPYSAPRYRYHWGGMLFTAIGFGKPVVASDDMNPEVFELYRVGETFASGNTDDLARVLENFINDFDKNFPTYSANLRAAGEDFSPVNFARRLEKIIRQ